MYFFLDNRSKQFKARLVNATPGIEVLQKAVKRELENKAPNTLALTAQKTAHKLAEYGKKYIASELSLNSATKNTSGLLSSLFFPWTKEYRLREEAGKNLAKAESKFSKLTNILSNPMKSRSS